MISVSTYIKIGLALLLIGLGYYAFGLYEKLTIAKEQLKKATADLVLVNTAKAKAEAAQLELSTKLAAEQERTNKVVTKLVKIPVVVEEKCMSPVLKEALKEND